MYQIRAAAFRQRLAAGASAGTQSSPLDDPHWSGRTGGHHQDPAAALLLPGWPHHPQGTPPHFASSPGLAMQNQFSRALAKLRALHSHPGHVHGVCLSTGLPNHLADPRHAGSRVSPAAIRPLIPPVVGAAARQNPLRVADTLGTRPNPSEPGPCQPFPLLFIPRLTSLTAYIRWIPANASPRKSKHRMRPHPKSSPRH